MNKKGNTALKTYRLDVSSQFYPIISTPRSQSLYRVTTVMDSPVRAELLQTAAEETLRRFPTFKVRLKKGYAWYYFEENPERFQVTKAGGALLEPINSKETAGYLFRLSYEDCRIVFEVFHAVCDGLAALEFIKAMVLRYAQLSGADVISDGKTLDLNAAPSDGETEDSFYRYYRPIKFGDVNLKGLMGDRPQLLEGTLTDDGYKSSFESLSTADAAACAKDMGVTFTALMCGAMAYSIEKVTRGKKSIVMMVPVNLRKMFPSVTLRNFVNFVRLVFKPKECATLRDYIASASRQLKEKATKEEMEKFVSTTVRTEKSLPLRITPLWLKIFIARIARALLKSRQTMIFSNMGKVSVPKGCGIKRILFNLNVSKTSKVNVGALSVGDEVTITFTRSIKENTVEKAFFDTLAALGLRPLAKGNI